jgi:hypothetical protein
MSDFLLSPGITPLLTDTALVLFLSAIGAGAALGGRRGFVLGLGVAGTLVGAIKLYTDWADLKDDLIALVAIAAVLYWAIATERPTARTGFPRGLAYAGAVVAILTGLYKTGGDFYDPFDLLVAFSALLAGIGVTADLLRSRRSTPS